MQNPFCHSSSILVKRPAPIAFELMADGIKQGTWAWGSFNRTEIKPNLFQGTSVFSGQKMSVYSRGASAPNRMQTGHKLALCMKQKCS
mgnify:CR=1 FL=1